ICAVAPGDPNWLPRDSPRRQHLARRVADLLLNDSRGGWDYDCPAGPQATAMLPRWQRESAGGYRPEAHEVRLLLLRLGRASVAPLVEGVCRELKRLDREQPGAEASEWRSPYINGTDLLPDALNLLVDLRDPAVVPILAAQLERTRHRPARA